MSDRVVFPLLTGWNSPSYVLEALRTLLALGVPEENVRFLPRIGHFAVPEVCEQEPPGPSYDPESGRATVYSVIPSEVRPRLTVSVRSETVMRFWEEADGAARHDERVRGRLAHFLPPLLAGIPGTEPQNDETPEDPLDRLTRQMETQYPELMATLPPGVQEDLTLVADEMMALLRDAPNEVPRRRQRSERALQFVTDPQARADCRAAFGPLTQKIPATDVPGIDDPALLAARTRFQRWENLVFAPNADADRLEQEAGDLPEAERREQHTLWRAFQRVVSFETAGERRQVIRELMEILTTEAFLAVAALDAMNGIAWVHGPLAEICQPAAAKTPDGLLMSVTGGQHRRGLLLTLMQRWAQSPEGVLGVRRPPDDPETAEGEEPVGAEGLDLGILDEAERLELFSLALWRRETGDARAVLETAAQRLIHPNVEVQWERFQAAPGRLGTLLAQPGQTAVLGGPALLQFPGLIIRVPLAEEADDEAVRAKALLQILRRLFVPVACRVEVIWQEAVARLNGSTYLHHDFQRGVRFADAWAALTDSPDEEAAQPVG